MRDEMASKKKLTSLAGLSPSGASGFRFSSHSAGSNPHIGNFRKLCQPRNRRSVSPHNPFYRTRGLPASIFRAQPKPKRHLACESMSKRATAVTQRAIPVRASYYPPSKPARRTSTDTTNPYLQMAGQYGPATEQRGIVATRAPPASYMREEDYRPTPEDYEDDSDYSDSDDDDELAATAYEEDDRQVDRLGDATPTLLAREGRTVLVIPAEGLVPSLQEAADRIGVAALGRLLEDRGLRVARDPLGKPVLIVGLSTGLQAEAKRFQAAARAFACEALDAAEALADGTAEGLWDDEEEEEDELPEVISQAVTAAMKGTGASRSLLDDHWSAGARNVYRQMGLSTKS